MANADSSLARMLPDDEARSERPLVERSARDDRPSGSGHLFEGSPGHRASAALVFEHAARVTIHRHVPEYARPYREIDRFILLRPPIRA